MHVFSWNWADLLEKSDFISLHVPHGKEAQPLIGIKEFAKMRHGVGIVNAARGGVIDEIELLNALDTGKVAFAGLDVFENEPHPNEELLNHPRISLTPHVGASTLDAQERIGVELAEKIIAFFNN